LPDQHNVGTVRFSGLEVDKAKTVAQKILYSL
jgi:hypothetical protein